jgi:hypothetical protein
MKKLKFIDVIKYYWDLGSKLYPKKITKLLARVLSNFHIFVCYICSGIEDSIADTCLFVFVCLSVCLLVS